MVKPIKQHVVRKGGFPDLRLTNRFWRAAAELARDGIVGNVRAQQQADGNPLKRNAPSTRARKQKLGRAQLSLIDDPSQYRFARKSNYEIVVRKDSMIVRPRAQKILRYVQDKGYTGWMRPPVKWMADGLRKLLLAALKKRRKK
jgi:hypothetical protein